MDYKEASQGVMQVATPVAILIVSCMQVENRVKAQAVIVKCILWESHTLIKNRRPKRYDTWLQMLCSCEAPVRVRGHTCTNIMQYKMILETGRW